MKRTPAVARYARQRRREALRTIVARLHDSALDAALAAALAGDFAQAELLLRRAPARPDGTQDPGTPAALSSLRTRPGEALPRRLGACALFGAGHAHAATSPEIGVRA